MICIYGAKWHGVEGSRAYHDDEDESKRTCNHGDHIRITKADAKRYEKMANTAHAGQNVFYRELARTIREQIA